MAGANSITIDLLKKYDFPIQKKYGQNFLIDDNILRGIADAAQISGEDVVLEIGPGLGALTGILCREAKHVIAVEIDRMLIPVLHETLADYDNLTLIHQDILKVSIAQEFARVRQSAGGTDRLKVVANLPYYITTPIIMQLLENEHCISSITVMVQKEVARRMSEGPGSKSYGALSLAVQYYAQTQYVMTVSRNCFLPKPDVDSAVIRLDVYDPQNRPVRVSDEAFMFRLIKAAFNQRRKTLVNAAANSADFEVSRDCMVRALAEMKLAENIRGEALTLEEFAQLSDLILQYGC